MKFIFIAIIATLSFGTFAQTGARTPDFKVKKTTGLVKHEAFSSFYQTGYRNLNIVLSDALTKYGCQSKATIKVLREPGIFSKGEFIGTFESKCYNPNIKDIDVYFEVYPYDEESASVVQVTLKNGKKEAYAYCWDSEGTNLKCSAVEVIRQYGFNFKK